MCTHLINAFCQATKKQLFYTKTERERDRQTDRDRETEKDRHRERKSLLACALNSVNIKGLHQG